MNGNNFRDWLKGVLSRLKENTVIVMYNALYHSIKQEKCPTTYWMKADIVQWPQGKRVVDYRMIVPEHLYVVQRIKSMYNTLLIKLFYSKTKLLRLPPYHCEFNQI